jgi:hypothetical protein
LEFLPQLLALLSLMGAAFLAILLWPFTALLRRLRRGRGATPAEPKDAPAPTPEAPDDRIQARWGRGATPAEPKDAPAPTPEAPDDRIQAR